MGTSPLSESLTARSTFSATWVGVTAPAAYACAKSVMAQRCSRCWGAFCGSGCEG